MASERVAIGESAMHAPRARPHQIEKLVIVRLSCGSLPKKDHFKPAFLCQWIERPNKRILVFASTNMPHTQNRGWRVVRWFSVDFKKRGVHRVWNDPCLPGQCRDGSLGIVCNANH